MATRWLVRISESNKEARRDYAVMLDELETLGYGVWDKDAHNKIKMGDYIGFIVGPVDAAEVYIYRVSQELTCTDRKPYWTVSNRLAIQLVRALDASFEWDAWRTAVGLKSTYWPRGTNPTRAFPTYVNERLVE
jgi:hypothetical protein